MDESNSGLDLFSNFFLFQSVEPVKQKKACPSLQTPAGCNNLVALITEWDGVSPQNVLV